uniref:Thioredoxin domain-containing protein EC-YbbN n=1 Tax=Vitiosangium cumulatum TaxID=1867796 RepID=A0A7D5BTH2_9BACT|nr:thioredoxin domain-containing protein EC-YbbN [Vitiosangium cumulatum]
MELRHLSWVLLAVWGCATSGAASNHLGEQESQSPVAFIDNDQGAALRAAREKHLPVFVEAWAPWCHACRAMRATVLNDPALKPWSSRFIWLAVDTDNPSNEDFLSRFPVDTWPTLLVLDPERETLVARSLGAVSVPQLVEFLEQAEHAFREGRQEAEAGITRADALAVSGAHAEAIAAYQQALSRLPQDGPLRAGAVVSLLKSLSATDNPDECMRLTARELPHLSRVGDRARVLYVGIGCSLDVETEEAATLRTRLAEETARAIAAPAEALVPDVRSSLYEALIEIRQMSGDEEGTKSLAEQWLTFIEESAGRARGAEERSAFDTHRMMAAMILEQPERAIPALERSERELPTDYNPPARLSELYLQTGQLDPALRASDRALSRVPRATRGTVLASRARILLARGERAQAEQMLTAALQELEGTDGFGTWRQRLVLQRTLNFIRSSGH